MERSWEERVGKFVFNWLPWLFRELSTDKFAECVPVPTEMRRKDVVALPEFLSEVRLIEKQGKLMFKSVQSRALSGIERTV